MALTLSTILALGTNPTLPPSGLFRLFFQEEMADFLGNIVIPALIRQYRD